MAFGERVRIVTLVGVNAPNAGRVDERATSASRGAAVDLPVQQLCDAPKAEVVALVAGGRAAVGVGAVAEGASQRA